MFKASLLGALTWRVMEEVDNALLRCVEEGSGHGVVLSISTEKLKRQVKKGLEVAGRAGGRVPVRRQLWAGRTPTASLCLQLCLHWRDQLRGAVSQTQEGQGAPHPGCILQQVLPAGDMPQSSPGWAGSLWSSKS